MKKIGCYVFPFCLICLFLSLSNPGQAQEAIAPNGKFATVNGLKLYYEDIGKGMPLVLLHGFGRTASDWKSHLELTKFYRIIAIDLPGHGRSDYMDTTQVFSHKKAAQYILGLLAQLKIDSIHVMGLSSGAMITLHLATLKPQLTKKIIIDAGQVYFSSTTRKVIATQDPKTLPKDRIEGMMKAHGKEKGVLLLNQFFHFRKLYGDPAFTPEVLTTIQAKALIIHGDNDPIAPVSNAWEMYQHIPKAHLWIVPQGGHVPHIKPGNGEYFNKIVLEFLRGDYEAR
jgi:pimeloyl-ACP methyl ester carboxylesterase